jgi:hypothetical protein
MQKSLPAEEFEMTFQEALKILGIEDYAERIFKSNSRGELFHLYQYGVLAKAIQDNYESTDWFRPWFENVVDVLSREWKRPESVYQHIGTIFTKTLEYGRQNKEP